VVITNIENKKPAQSTKREKTSTGTNLDGNKSVFQSDSQQLASRDKGFLFSTGKWKTPMGLAGGSEQYKLRVLRRLHPQLFSP